MPDLPHKRKSPEPVVWSPDRTAPLSERPQGSSQGSGQHAPISVGDSLAPPLSDRPSRRAFLELCESVRFRLDRPIEIDPQARKRARAMFLEERSELLGTTLKIDERSTPEVATLLRTCCDRLRRTVAPEAFVGGEEDNASSYSVAPDDLQFLVFGGRLFEILTPEEMLSVIGHEMGHQALHPFSLRRSESPLGRMQSLLQSQAREISADRIGLLGCTNPEASASALVWVATKLPRRLLRLRMDSLMEQVAEIPANANGWQLFCDHPFLHFRIWALMRFSESDLYRAHAGNPGGIAFETIETEICARFQALGGGEYQIQRDLQIAEALLWLATLALSELPSVPDAAKQSLSQLVGAIQAEAALRILAACGAEEVRARAHSAVMIAGSTDSEALKFIKNRLDSLCLGVGLNLTATDAWIVLQECQSRLAED